MMCCPNCGSYGQCDCTWTEIEKAIEIRRRKAREFRRAIGRPTVVEKDEQERKEKLRR